MDDALQCSIKPIGIRIEKYAIVEVIVDQLWRCVLQTNVS